MKELSRRNYIRNALLSASALLVGNKLVKANSCLLTPEQTEGPFYPELDQNDKDNDLTILKGSKRRALGEVIIIHGVITDESCQPVDSALVEIWQACESGKYNHSGDPNSAKLDPNFQYWGRSITNNRGEYSFKTIRPGHYPASSSWMRPSHVHVKVHRRGYEELTTQMYFSDDPHNSKDRILQSLSRDEKKKVIVDFKQSKSSFRLVNSSPKRGRFDMTIRTL